MLNHNPQSGVKLIGWPAAIGAYGRPSSKTEEKEIIVALEYSPTV